MKTMKKYILMFVVGCLGLTSCIGDLDTMPLDDNNLVTEKVYSSREGYMGVLAKCYASLILTGQQGGDGGDGDLEGANEGYSGYTRLLFYLQELNTDNFLMPSSSNGLRNCLNLNWDATTSVVTWTYQRLYMAIAYCNEFLRECTPEKMQERGVWDAMSADYLTLRAEARFIRAYCYSMLCDLYGNVPIIDEYVGVKDIPVQKSRKEVFEYVESELKAILGETGSTDELLKKSRQNEYGRVDEVAAWFLLSRMYLNAEVYTGQARWDDCLTYADKIITGGDYRLASDYRHIFLADNETCTEIIWPLVQDGDHAQSSAGTNFYVKAFVNGPMDELYQTGVGSRGWGNVRSKTTLVDAFDPADVQFDENDTWGNGKNDKRAQFMTALKADDGTPQTKETWDANLAMTSTFTCGYGYIKWRNVNKNDDPADEAYTSIDWPMFRTADAYLMAAEAILRAGGDRNKALGYVNEVRARAYMSDNYGTNAVSGKIGDGDLTLDFILDERQRELASECIRRTDLIRFDKFTRGNNWDWKNGERLGSDVDDKYELFPIPESELTNNPTLKQNPGY